MDFMLKLPIASPEPRIRYSDKIFVIGSCFTEHIGGRLKQLKFNVLQNPNGILFDPVSVGKAVVSYINNKHYGEKELFYLNELWQSWQHHSTFSGLNKDEVIDSINKAQHRAHTFLKECDWLIITLGSSFSYRLVETGDAVANCHRAPAQWFNKHLLDISETIASLETTLEALSAFNSRLKIIFTISPVRHIRDGVIENNRSKARLIESVHALLSHWPMATYFPAYELVIDVLRDYRFYDIDLVHPNYAATEFVFDAFIANYLEPAAQPVVKEVKNIITAYKHRPFQPESTAHRKFLQSSLQKLLALQQQHPHLDFGEELRYFSANTPVPGPDGMD